MTRRGSFFAFALGAVMACAAGPARAETVLGFVPVPEAHTFRTQVVTPQKGEDWPFTERRVTLACNVVWGQRIPLVMHVGDGASEGASDGSGDRPRVLPLSANPLQTFFYPARDRSLLRDFAGLEDRYRALVPFMVMGMGLCDQPEGATIGPGEL